MSVEPRGQARPPTCQDIFIDVSSLPNGDATIAFTRHRAVDYSNRLRARAGAETRSYGIDIGHVNLSDLV